MSRQQNYTLGKNTDNNIASEYPNYTLQGDYGYSYDSRSDYYQRRLEDRENDINYDNKTTNEDSTKDSKSRISNWWTSRSMPELLQSSEDADDKDKNITVLDYMYDEAEKSGDIKALDVYRSFMEKKDQSKLSRLQNEVREGEANYLNSINLAKDYLTSKQELIDLQRQIDSATDWTPTQIQSAQNRIIELEDNIKNIENGVNQLDQNGNIIYHQPGLKELARTNPYLQDIFYETRPGKLFSTDKFGSVTDLWKYYSFDWLAEDYIGDLNPGNNFKHLLANDGINDAIFGRTHQLSPDQIEYMWSSKNQGSNLAKQIEQLNNAEKVVSSRLADKNQQIQSMIHTLKHGNWLYDPSKISAEFREKQENNQISAFNPESWIYALPELGTSYSEFGAMLGQFGTSMAAKWASKAVMAAGSGGTAPLLIGAAELATQAAITNYTRNSETQAEVFDSFKQRVLEGADQMRINLPSVIQSADEQLKARGFDTSEMTDYEVLENALSQNIITPDANFNQLVNDSQKGLDVVRQTNQALMLSDLAQGMFMFGGSYMKNYFGLQKAAKRAVGNRNISSGLETTVIDRLRKDDLYAAADGIIDRTIARAVDKAWKTPGGKTRAYNAISNLTNIGKKLGVSYFMEKTEEGQQGVVSNYYRTGKYDNAGDYSLLQGAANALKLAGEAHMAYYGIHPDENLNGDADLRKSMDIGGFTGLFMSGVFSSPDVYSATAQYLTDSNLRGYIADGYGNAERQNKVEQFMNAASSDGRKGYSRIINNLETLKDKFKPEGVTNEMIDEDIRLVNNIERLSNNKSLRSITDELGINNDDFISVVKNAVYIQDRLKDASEASEASTREIESVIQKIREDADLKEEIKQHYSDYLARYDKKRSDRRRQIVNDLPASDITSRSKKELSEYVDQLLGERSVLSEEEYANEFMGRMVAVQDYNDLLTLRDELNSRKQDLQRLKEDKNLDVNVDGISGIIKYVESQIEERKPVIQRFLGEEVGEQVMDLGLSVPFADQLSVATISKYVNDGARADLFAHALAYTTGKYVGDTRLYKPTYNNLTEEQQKQILTNEMQADKINGKTRTSDQIIQDYDNSVNEEWNKDDKLADQDLVQRKRAMSVIQKDLQRKKDQEQVSREEIAEDTGNLADIEQGTPNTETKAPEVAPMDEVEEVTIPDVQIAEQEISSLEDQLNMLEEAIEGSPLQDRVSVDEVEADVEMDGVTNTNQDIEDEVQMQNPAEEVTSVEPTDIAEEAEEQQTDDSTAEESQGQQEEVDDAQFAPAEESLQDEEEGSAEQPTVTEVEDTPAASDIAPQVENPVNITEVEDTPKSDEIFYDAQNDQLVYMPDGNPENGIPVNDQDILEQSAFEESYDFDSRLQGPSSYYNRSTNGWVAARKKFRRLHIANTFFFQPNTDEVMPITVAGKSVKFVGKDGGKVDRRPGRELADNLAIPGWLSTADDIYFVVTSFKHDMSFDSAIDNLAIHVMIEKDGKLYNASVRAINQSLYDRMRDTEMTQGEIDEQIQKLRELRAKIIKAYAPEYSTTKTLPLTARKHVKPVGIRISNGQLDNQVDEAGLPKFRKLTEVSDFGITEDAIAMSEQITSGDIQFGYGTGPFGVDPFSIDDMFTRDKTETQGIGYAGKIYFIPKPEDTPSGTATLPIMLSEELHRISGVNNPEQVKLAFNADGTQNVDEQGKPVAPSTAELIFNIITGQTSVRGSNAKIIDSFLLSLLANSGSNTFTNGLEGVERIKYNFLVRKQLGIYTDDKGNRFFVNGYYSEDATVYTQEGPRTEKRFSTQFTNLATLTDFEKRRIVFQISQNIHWNTDKDVLMSEFPQEFIDLLVSIANSSPNLVKDENSRIPIFSKDLTFSLKEIGYTFKDGKAVKVSDSPLVITWAINNGILKTDLGEHAFYAPFIYADDATINREELQKQQDKPKPTVNTQDKVIEDVSKPSQAKTASGKKVVIAERATPENLEKYGLSIPDNGMKESQYLKWGIVLNPKTGKREVTLTPIKFLGGLKSTIKGRGKFNEDSAKKWLFDKLGIDSDQILVTDQMIKFGANEEAYGLFSVVMDALSNELIPRISLSRQSGAGVEYHEAFHYVTQMLLSEQQRTKLYQEYSKSKRSARNLTQDEAEEALAEEFRNYAKDQNGKGLLYNVIRIFKKIYNTLYFWNSHRNIIRAFFKSINDGQFKDYKASKQALEDFYSRKPEGLSYYIPGLSKEEEAKLPHITDPDVFYHAVNSLTSGALSIFNIRTIEDVHNLNTSLLFDRLQQNIDFGWISDEYVDIAQDIVNNKDIFTRYVRKKIEQLGIREVEKVDNEEESRLKVETGEQSENNWDKNQGEVSKKDNASFRAKLFFYSIPKYEYQFVEDEETGVITKELFPVHDDMFQLPVTEDFNFVWNQIMENLWDIDKYQDIIDRSANLGNTIPFFKSLYDILTSEEAPISDNTKTQLEITIKSSKVQLDTITTKHPKVNTRGKSEDEIASEIQSSLSKFNWVVEDSDNLRKVGRLPARWSGMFFASDAIDRTDSGRPFIKPEFAKFLKDRRGKLSSTFKIVSDRIKKGKPVDDTKIQEIKDTLLDVFNALSIPMDNLALDYMLNNFYIGTTEFDKLYNFWKGTGAGKTERFNEGTLATLIKLAETKDIGVKSTSGGGYSRTLDRMFTFGRNSNSQIAVMAISYGKVHPSPQEFSVVGADGALIYPISENNYMTDQIRNINQDANGKKQQILSTPFSAHSLIANANNTKFKLHTFLALNIDESSRDYFGITPVEDYIAKLTLTFNDRMILPTMSDKKTWYSISGIKMVKDILTSKYIDIGDANYAAIIGEDLTAENSTYVGERRFSQGTLNIFANYWLDEFNAVWDYFQKKDYIAQHPTLRVDNYHGKIKNGKMDHTGNGGRFRYFTRLRLGEDVLNVNQELARLEQYGTTEEVQKYLSDLKVLLLGASKPNSKEVIEPSAPIFSAINHLLLHATQREMRALVKRGILGYSNGEYVNKLIPSNIFDYYKSELDSSMYTSEESGLKNQDILFSVIGSHVANQAISIMEVEKCFTGDPAYYKWKKSKFKTEQGDSIDIITGKDVDKIKRLSSVLSTGTNLRTIWDNPAENDTKVTVMHLADNMLGSDYYDELKSIFRNSILRDLYSEAYPNLSDNEIIEALSTKQKEDAFYNSLTKNQKQFVDSYTNASARPYDFRRDDKGDIKGGNINQSDAAVYIRPAMYRRIMKALGQWSDAIEEAYQIMEGEDESWMNNPELYQKTLALVVKPLKMVYFGDHRENDINLNVPVFDKMAMFPLFKVIAKADNKVLYDRMNNEELGVIDMVTFESAVKVGGRTKFEAYEGPKNEHFNVEGLNKKSFNLTKKEGDLPVFVQDIRNLRLQLNTDPHEHIDRSFGTQAVKICLGNLIDDRVYGTNKATTKTGQQIKTQTMDAINQLSDIGYKRIIKRFFRKGKLNNKALSDYLVSQAVSSGMSDEFVKGLTLDQDGNILVPLAAQSSRQWIESRIISFINKEVVDINTPGGSAIQMSSFGLKATDARMKESQLNGAFNGGNKLRFLNKDGSMDVILSTNFFRHIVPKEYQTSYGTMKKWLTDHNVIGTNSTPQGIGYRIPTQGLSSTFSFKVVDVLPDRFSDTIVVPDEFTAMTGSDFDVDKLYIAMLNYDADGNIVQYTSDKVSEQSSEALQNMIIQNYQLVVSDTKNMAETRASIDTLTGMLQDDVLPLISSSSKQEADPFYELLPSFQESRKEEYTSGKAGIAPFALNSTNHVLTQLMHLNMIYSHSNVYQLGDLDAIKGQDGFRILDWLSAMINAHVDVAKDPYIIALNVNQVTYNMTNLLLRGGKGKNTFYFLAQPILKELSNRVINSKGVYGAENLQENQIITGLYNVYGKLLKEAIDALPEGENKQNWKAKYNGLAEEIGYSAYPGIKSEVIDKTQVFDESSLIYALKNKKQDNLPFLYQQIIVLHAYKELSMDAKTLSELVHRSQIDTKKFGNNLALQLNFVNSYQTFIYDNSGVFEIKGKEVDDALKYYFSNTFLSKKLYNATTIARKILKSQTFPATWTYQNIFNSVMGNIVGGDIIKGTDGNDLISYKHQGDKKFVQNINRMIDSIIRARATSNTDFLKMTDDQFRGMFIGKNTMCSRLTKLKRYLLLNKEAFPHLINQDGTIKNELLNYLQEYPADGLEGQNVDRIILSESSMNNDYDRENQLISAFAQLLEDTDDVVREFAEDLVKYAYYTSYDERGVNAFFHLVPIQYKIDNGYVSNIKEVLEQFKNGGDVSGYSSIAQTGDDPQSMSFPSIRLTIARNMWDDPNIVPKYNINLKPNSNDPFQQQQEDRSKSSDYDIVLSKSRSNIGGKAITMYDSFAVPHYRTRRAEFITVNNGSGYNTSIQLYQLIGEIAYVNDEGKKSKRGAKLIYKRIPKLGIKENGFRVNEFAKGGLNISAFDQNAFDENVLTDDSVIAETAMSRVKLPRLKDESRFTKQFIPLSSDNIQVKINGTQKQIEGDVSDTQVVDTTFNIDPLSEDNVVYDETDVSDFVNVSLEESFDGSEAMDIINEQLDIFSDMQEQFSQETEDPFANVDTSSIANEAFNMDVTEDVVDMTYLAEMGKKRKKECE